MGIISRAELLAELTPQTERLPFGKGEVIVTELPAAEYVKLWNNEAIRVDGEVDNFKFTAALVARCLVDDNGERILTDADAEAISRSSRRPLMQLVDVAKRLNGLGDDAIKNSVETAADALPSVSASS